MDLKQSSLELRKYQELILSQAKKRNTIAYLPTGAGKTLIACHVIQSRIENVRIQRENRTENEWGKIIVFIAPQKVLLHQQIEYVRLHASPITAAEFTGERVKNSKQIDNWKKEEWKPEIEANEVLGMTPDILLRILQNRVIPPEIIDTIVIDECHNAVGKHPMGSLCDMIKSTPQCNPLILGLTASPINNKKKGLDECILQLEQRLNAEFFYPNEEFLLELQQSFRKPKMLIIDHGYPSNATTEYFKEISDSFETIVKICQVHTEGSINFHSFQRQKTNPKNPYYERILSSLNVTDGNSFYPRLDKRFPFAKRVIFQTIEITKEGGIYLGLASLSVSLALHDEEIRMKQTFQESLLRNHIKTLSGKELSLLEPFITNEFSFLNEGSSSTLQQSVKSVDTKLLDSRVLEITSYLRNDLKKFISLLDQSYSSFKGFCELIYYFAEHLGSQNCARALHEIQKKKNENDFKWSVSNERIQFFQDLIRAASENRTFPYEQNIHKELYKGNYFRDLIFICDELRRTIPFEGVVQKFVPVPLRQTSVPFNYDHFSTKVEALLNIFISVVRTSNSDTRHYSTKEVSLGRERNIDNYEAFQNEVQSAIQGQSLPSSPVLSPISSKGNSASAAATGSSIIFCNMRIMALALNQFFEQLSNSWTASISESFPFISDTILGTDSSSKQRKTLQNLRQKKINVLFATDVAQEGLDIPQCNMIINWNNPKTLVGFIQRRGRARSQQSLLISFFKSITEKTKENFELKDFYNFLEEEHRTNDILQEFMNAFEKPHSLKTALESYTIPSTGANIDAVKAKALLYEYCEYLSQVLSKEYEKGNLDVSYFDANSVKFCYPLVLFHQNECQLFLPEIINIRLRKQLKQEAPIIFPEFKCVITKKKVAEGNVILQSIKYLHEMKEFDDHFRYRDPIISFHTTTETSGPNSPAQKQSSSVDQMKIIRVKSIPDRQKNTPEFRTHQPVCLISFYAMEMNSEFDPSRLNSKVLSQYNTLKSTIIGFPSKLSDQMTNTEFPIHFESFGYNNLSFRYKYIGDKQLSDTEYLNLLSFMSFIGDLVSFEIPSLPANEFINLQQSKEAYETFFLPKSSSLLEHVHQPFFLFPAEGVVTNINHIDSSYYSKLAVEGLRFIHNMKTIQQRNLNPNAFPSKFIHFQENSEEMDSIEVDTTEEIFTTNGKMLYCYEQRTATTSSSLISSNLKRLSDMMDEKRQVTFYAYYSKQFGRHHAGIQQFLEKNHTTTEENTFYLSKAHNLTGVFTFIPLFHYFNVQEQAQITTSQKHEPIDVIPSLCFSLGLLSSYNFSLLLPSLLHRIQSIFLAEELQTKYFSSFDTTKAIQDELPSSPSASSSLYHILTAMTPRRKEENLNSERLEFIGDAFLKYSTSLLVFLSSPTDNEAKLTSSRMKVISNRYLADRALTISKVHEYLRIIPLGKEENHPATLNLPKSKGNKKKEKFLSILSPPHSEKILALSPRGSLRNVNIYLPTITTSTQVTDENNQPTEVKEDELEEGYDEVQVHEKTIADMVESLLGVTIHPQTHNNSPYQIGSHGEYDGFTLLSRLSIIPEADLHYLLNKQESIANYLTHLQSITSRPPISQTTLSLFETNHLLYYSFQYKDLLSLSLTHPTLSSVWNYQRLEFLGDSILDYLIGQYLFSISKANRYGVQEVEEWDEGILSKLKTFFTNNDVLAEIACTHFQLFEFLQHEQSMHMAQLVTDERHLFAQKQQQGLDEIVETTDDLLDVKDDGMEGESKKKKVVDIFSIINSYLDRNPTILQITTTKTKEEDNNRTEEVTPSSPEPVSPVTETSTKGSSTSGGSMKRKVFADMLEALIGAIYLDCGGDLNVIARFLEDIGFFHVSKEQLNILKEKILASKF